VCDNQVVSVQWPDGRTASLTMAAHTALICEVRAPARRFVAAR
jgi:hypothetical protein